MVNEDQGDDNDNFLEVRPGVRFIPGDPGRGYTPGFNFVYHKTAQ